MKIIVGDYFKRSDVEALTQGQWTNVRAAIRSLGHKVDSGYGMWRRGPLTSAFVKLTVEGNLVWCDTVPNNAYCRHPKDFLPAKQFESVKFGTHRDADRFRVAADHLLSLGYEFLWPGEKDAMYLSADKITGIHGNRAGGIDLYQLEVTFNELDAQEYTFDVAVDRKVYISGIERVRKYIDVQGVQVEEQALKAFLESQKSANQSA